MVAETNERSFLLCLCSTGCDLLSLGISRLLHFEYSPALGSCETVLSPVFFCDVWFLAFKVFRVTSGGQEAGKEGSRGLFQMWAASM